MTGRAKGGSRLVVYGAVVCGPDSRQGEAETAGGARGSPGGAGFEQKLQDACGWMQDLMNVCVSLHSRLNNMLGQY